MSASDVHDVALGCAVLGCGGGGDVLLGELRAQQQLLAGKAIRVASVDQGMTVMRSQRNFCASWQKKGSIQAF